MNQYMCIYIYIYVYGSSHKPPYRLLSFPGCAPGLFKMDLAKAH